MLTQKMLRDTNVSTICEENPLTLLIIQMPDHVTTTNFDWQWIF